MKTDRIIYDKQLWYKDIYDSYKKIIRETSSDEIDTSKICPNFKEHKLRIVRARSVLS